MIARKCLVLTEAPAACLTAKQHAHAYQVGMASTVQREVRVNRA